MTSLLAIHIVFISFSLILSIILAATAIFKVLIPRIGFRSMFASTLIGVLSGAALLLQAPLGARCAVLTGYTIVAIGVYHFAQVQNTKLALSRASS